MGKRVHIALATLLVAVVGLIAWQALHDSEPVYKRERLSFWLREADCFPLALEESNRVTVARAAIRQIGTNGIPALLKLLARKDSFVAAKLVDFWDRHRYSLPAWARYPGWYRNQARALNNDAALGFEILGADAQQAAPALIRLFERNVSPSSQSATSRALNGIGLAAQRAAIPLFVRAAGSSDPTERGIAIWALLSVDAEHADRRQVVPALANALADTNFVFRALAARGLGRFGTNAQPAVPALVGLLTDPQRGARTDATNALRKIDPQTAARAGVEPLSDN